MDAYTKELVALCQNEFDETLAAGKTFFSKKFEGMHEFANKIGHNLSGMEELFIHCIRTDTRISDEEKKKIVEVITGGQKSRTKILEKLRISLREHDRRLGFLIDGCSADEVLTGELPNADYLLEAALTTLKTEADVRIRKAAGMHPVAAEILRNLSQEYVTFLVGQLAEHSSGGSEEFVHLTRQLDKLSDSIHRIAGGGDESEEVYTLLKGWTDKLSRTFGNIQSLIGILEK